MGQIFGCNIGIVTATIRHRVSRGSASWSAAADRNSPISHCLNRESAVKHRHQLTLLRTHFITLRPFPPSPSPLGPRSRRWATLVRGSRGSTTGLAHHHPPNPSRSVREDRNQRSPLSRLRRPFCSHTSFSRAILHKGRVLYVFENGPHRDVHARRRLIEGLRSGVVFVCVT